MSYDIALMFFDDGISSLKPTGQQPLLLSLVDALFEMDIKELGERLAGLDSKIHLHSRWHGLGTKDIAAYNVRACVQCVPELFSEDCRLNNQLSFREALNWCRTGEISGICFVDLNFIGVRIETCDIECAGTYASSLGGGMEPTRYFNEQRHGLLLIAALVANEKADADIWIVSAANGARVMMPLVAGIQPGLGRNRVIGRCNPILIAASHHVAQELIETAIKIHLEARFTNAGDFWKSDSERWFVNNVSYPRHSHDPKCEQSRQVLLPYVSNLNVPCELANRWLGSTYFYENLKRFVGHCSRAQNIGPQTKPLQVNCLVIPLLLAVGSRQKQWMYAIDWRHGLPPILSTSDISAIRQFLQCTFDLFASLGSQKAGHPTNNVDVTLLYDSTCRISNLSIFFEFDCESTFNGGRCLLDKLTDYRAEESQGDACRAYHALKKLLNQSTCPSGLTILVEPVNRNGSKWTKLSFIAKNPPYDENRRP